MAGRTKKKNEWLKENRDRINLTVPKGQKETIEVHATAHGESTNGFINRAIGVMMALDTALESFEEKVPEFTNEHGLFIEDSQSFSRELLMLSVLESRTPGITKFYCSHICLQSVPEFK